MYSLRYSSTRREVWRWYWRAWARPAGLWQYHVTIGVTAAVAILSAGGDTSFRLGSFAVAALLCTFLCAVVFPLWPQLKFKSAERLLEIGEAGCSTTVGKVSGSRS